MLILEMYDKLALMTGFPAYTNATDCPDINRFLLEMLSEGLQSTIDNLYISNNVLQRDDTIITIPERQEYGINGIIKDLQLVREDGKVIKLPYANKFDPNRIEDRDEKGELVHKGEPKAYCIRNGYLRLLPVPDKSYTLKVCVSTLDLVMADNDVSRTTIEHIDDSIMADDRFCNLVILKAATFVFGRCKNKNAELYANLYNDRIKTYIEHDFKSIEAQRGYMRGAGHYNPMRGLIDDDYGYGGLY